MSVRERLSTVQIHEAVNIYNSQAQLDKADVEMHRRLGGFNFQRRRLSTFFYKNDDIVSTSSLYGTGELTSAIIGTLQCFIFIKALHALTCV